MRAACSRAFPGATSSQRRVAAHTAGGTLVSGVRAAGGKIFYGKREPGENTVKLYVRDGVAGRRAAAGRSGQRSATSGPHFALDYYEPSQDGARVAYGVSPGGSEASVIHVLDVGQRQGRPRDDRPRRAGQPELAAGRQGLLLQPLRAAGRGREGDGQVPEQPRATCTWWAPIRPPTWRWSAPASRARRRSIRWTRPSIVDHGGLRPGGAGDQPRREPGADVLGRAAGGRAPARRGVEEGGRRRRRGHRRRRCTATACSCRRCTARRAARCWRPTRARPTSRMRAWSFPPARA